MRFLQRTSSLKRKRTTSSYLPDDCWEIIFKFLVNDNDNRRTLNSLSLVSKQFLSITNHHLFSLTVGYSIRPFLGRLFERFTDLNSLDLSCIHSDLILNDLLHQISNFPLNITSLHFHLTFLFPANGLRAFSQNITTLTSLTCSNFFHRTNELLLIADCFPLLKQLNLSAPSSNNKPTIFLNGMHSMLSKCRCIQHLDLHRTHFMNDQHVAELSLFLGDLVSIDLSECRELTESALFSLVRNCHSLSEIKMECTSIGYRRVWNSNSLVEFGVYPQLKSLSLAHCDWLRDEIIIMFASNFPNLQMLDLNSCRLISGGICQVLRRCCKIRHLNITNCSRVKLLGIDFVVSQLEVLNLSGTKVDDETLYVISKNCCGILKLLLKKCYNATTKGVQHVLENCTQLREISLDDFHLSESNMKLCLRNGCLLC